MSNNHKFETKFYWLLKNVRNLIVVCIRTVFHCIIHPKAVSELFFSFYSTLNEFYQVSHGKLIDFKETELFAKIKEKQIFATANYFNMDQQVMRPVEIQILASLTNYLNPKTIFEIGTYSGITTLHFCHNTDELVQIYTLDLPADFELPVDESKYSYDDKLVVELSQKNIDRRAFKGTYYENKVVELFGDSKTFDYTEFYGKIDLIFVDGNHSYEYVKSDTENALKMLSKDGIIVWHDFDYIVHRDVFKYLNSLSQELKVYSIRNTRFAVYGPNLF